MSVVDSEAVFAARCSKVGLSDAAVTALRSKGLGDIRQLCLFNCSYSWAGR